MNRWRRIGLVILSLGLLVSALPAIESKAADGDPYTYTLTFYAGNQGEFSGTNGLSGLSSKYTVAGGKDKITISGLSYRDRVSFNAAAMIQLPEDSKYYVKGIRQSGRDNNTVAQISSNSILVESDRDFVVAYGIKGDMVAYHINYRDEAGNALAPSETYYGNVGDKPVMAFLYIEGYEPQAYNLTRTLVSDESKNEFTFIYHKAAAGSTTTTVTDEGTNTVIVPGSVTILSEGDNAAGGAGTGTAGGDGTANADEGDNGEGGTTAIPDAEVPQGPGELMNLDDDEVPLAGIRDLFINSEGRFVYGASIIIGLAAVSTLIAMGVVMWKKRHEHAYEELDNWELK
ncbi:MAG: hypothetical protein HFI28_05700 [Lachnospiraceae bacterium]|jgi:hypothetical protein|nr:hypothetical protein [Lachnospiraceae bacterium]